MYIGLVWNEYSFIFLSMSEKKNYSDLGASREILPAYRSFGDFDTV